jgi:hypothetical protein
MIPLDLQAPPGARALRARGRALNLDAPRGVAEGPLRLRHTEPRSGVGGRSSPRF